MKKLKPIAGHIQVYNIWVNGRDINDINQHFPVTPTIECDRIWHNDLKKATKDFFNVKVSNDGEHGLHSDIFKDFHVALYSIDINIKEFENTFDLDFNLDNDRVQECIPYYVNYDFNVVAERVNKFI